MNTSNFDRLELNLANANYSAPIIKFPKISNSFLQPVLVTFLQSVLVTFQVSNYFL